jgi:hypothetical protein
MPSQLKTVKTFFLTSGIVNILILLGWSGGSLIGGLAGSVFTCGLSCLLVFVPLINIAAYIMDFIAYNKLNGLDKTDTFKTIQFAAILDIVSILSGNIISLIFGIITLSYISEPEVSAFLREKEIY